jgi:hypothetical protein
MSSMVTVEEPDNAALNAAMLERGRFFFPAGMHYGNPDAAVTCDRCRRTDLKTCIGFERFDYCLPCVEAISLAARQPTTITLPTHSLPREPAGSHGANYITAMMQVTLMAQSLFDIAPRTRMEQNMFSRWRT